MFNSLRIILLLAFVLVGIPSATQAQRLSLQDDFEGLLDDNPIESEPVKLSAFLKVREGTTEGTLNVRAEIADHWHVYSITQPKGGPLPAKIKLASGDGIKINGDFEPDSDPIIIEKDEIFGIRVEKHKVEVTWSAPVEIAQGIDPASIAANVRFSGQTCVSAELGGSCKQLSETVAVNFLGYEAATATNIKFKPTFSHLLLSGKIRRASGPGTIKPGDRIDVNITAEPTDHFHIYAQEQYQTDDAVSTPTIFAFTKQNGWTVNGPTTTDDVIQKDQFGILLRYHEDPVTWKFSLIVPTDAESRRYSFTGMMGFQTCTESCDPPDAAKFSFDVAIGSEIESEPIAFASTGTYGEINDLIKAKMVSHSSSPDEIVEPPAADVTHEVVTDTPEAIAEMAKLYDPNEKIRYLTYQDMDANPVGSGGTSSSKQTTFWTALLGAFLGGMILNLMPCVFPVLGLKVMGFVEQAGSDPRKIRMHGIAFAFGLIVSMWVLAGIILTIKLAMGQDVNWGAQMGNPYFVAFIIVLLFVLGLNMAGVFEMGTSMTRVGGSAQNQKGLSGSFFSGVLTTLIATPCSGPFLGAAMSYTLAQPALTAMFLFTVFAVGISMPYVLLSFFPALINRLPRPGAWMETFKVTMAFAMFAVVAFFMQAFGGQTGVGGLSWLAMALVVIGLAAFFYGTWSLPHIKPKKRIVFGNLMPLVIFAVGGWMCYDAANQRPPLISGSHAIGGLAWQDWNPGKIEYSLARNKRIIWVDYTADW